VRGQGRRGLLDAATRVVLAEGGAALTLDAVAHEAGVSKGGLLYHFPTKRRLVAGLVEHLVARFDAEVSAAHAEEIAVADSPGAWTRAWLRVAAGREVAELDRASAGLIAAFTEDPALLDPLRAAHARWTARMEDDGLDPVDVTLVRLVLDGVWLARLAGFAEPSPERAVALLARLGALAGAT